MPTWDQGLVGVHREVASNEASIIQVLAGPGTGKTFAMMRRVARLLEDGVTPEKILVVTFTRNAARDLREQLGQLGVVGADEVRASTLHSLCFKMLSTEQAFDYTNRTPRPLLSYEINCLDDDLAEQFGGKRKTRKLLSAYEAAWARLQHEEPGYAKSKEDQSFETELLSWLRFYQAMLIGELVPLTLDFIKENPALEILPPYEHVLVDEYQDLNKSDQSLVKAFAGVSSLLVIGDDNQSIYSFRHANPEGIRTFANEFENVEQYTIEECRRCPPNIVNISNSLISHDPHTTRPTPLVPDAGRPDATVWLVQHRMLDDEVKSVAEYVDHYLESRPDVNPGRVLVLTPRRFIGNAIKAELIRRGRNALSYFQEDAVDTCRAAEGYCLLSLLVDNTDNAALRAWVGLGSPDNRRKAVKRIRGYCENHSIGFVNCLQLLADGKIKIPYTSGVVDRWNQLQRKLAVLVGVEGIPLVDELWPANVEDVEDIRVLASNIAYKTPSPVKLLEELRTAITQPELPGSDDDIIQIMSFHKSKGLTRDLVVIAGCMAGTLPRVDEEESSTVQNAQLEEQRRLFYVAITRATHEVVISSSTMLLLKDAKRGGAKFSQIIFQNGNSYAVTAFTPFCRELGVNCPAPISGQAWRTRVGLP